MGSGREGPVERARRRAGARWFESLYDELAGTHTIGRPGWDLARFMAYALAVIIHLVALGALGCALLLLIKGWPNPFAIVAGLLILGILVVGRPRFGAINQDEFALHRIPARRHEDPRPSPAGDVGRDSAPELFRLLDSIRAELGGPRIDTIVVNAEFNLGVTRLGIRRRPVLFLGVPLWNILGPQERVAVLGHEVGHFVNGDLTRGLVVGSAIRSLGAAYDTLYDAAREDMGMITGLRFVVRTVLFVLRLPAAVGLYCLILISARAQQRAEFLADLLGVQVAGSDAARRLQRKSLLVRPAYNFLFTATRRGALYDIWTLAREEFSTFPTKKYDELLKESKAEDQRVDGDHPPTHLRIRLIDATEYQTARVALDTGWSRAIDGELETAYRAMAKEIRDLAREGAHI